MPPSQLKRLKASLREQGITGQQKSKKEKKQARGQNADQRVQRQAALQNIRDSFNPLEIKAPSRPSKFQATTSKTASGRPNGAIGRPGVTKSMGEEAVCIPLSFCFSSYTGQVSLTCDMTETSDPTSRNATPQQDWWYCRSSYRRE